MNRRQAPEVASRARRFHRWAIAAWLSVAALVCGRVASGHPAGFTSINRYLGLECGANGDIRIAYLLDFAELPAYAELDRLDANHDGSVTPDEQRSYLAHRLPPLVAAWTVVVNGAPSRLRIVASGLDVREGERGMWTLRISAEVAAERSPPLDREVSEVHVLARDPNYADRSGWREMAAQSSPGAVVVAGVNEPASAALSYAAAVGVNPPRVEEEEVTLRIRKTAEGTPAASPAPPVVIDARLASLATTLRRASGSLSFSLAALALAALLGAGHALSPGHGKAMAAAYLVGRRARASQALVFGASVTAAHTLVVFAVGTLAALIENTVGSERLMRALEFGSAVAVVALGVLDLSKRWRDLHGHEADHGHRHDEPPSEGLGPIAALGTSAGLTPCPSALALLLTAIAIRRYGFGLVLVLAFSFGVAFTLTGTGLLVVWARRLLDRVSFTNPFLRWLPVLSSACVLTVGVFLCAAALSSAPP